MDPLFIWITSVMKIPKIEIRIFQCMLWESSFSLQWVNILDVLQKQLDKWQTMLNISDIVFCTILPGSSLSVQASIRIYHGGEE